MNDAALRPKHIGARVKRVEDPRLLIGQGAFADDRDTTGSLHIAFRRSDHAHALATLVRALASLTNACFDLWAKSRGIPLWRLLLD